MGRVWPLTKLTKKRAFYQMNCCIDLGNTRIKVAFFDRDQLLDVHICHSEEELEALLAERKPARSALCTVGKKADTLLRRLENHAPVLPLSWQTPLPFRIVYDTPETLGVDRIAAVAGAWHLHPGMASLVIDAGTCITYDYIDANGQYHGGIISPGIEMRLRAMHHFTAALPSLALTTEAPLLGKSTRTAMLSGAINGTLGEIESIIGRYEEKFGALQVLACGGNSDYFESSIKRHIFAVPYLVLIGLNTILLHNEQIA